MLFTIFTPTYNRANVLHRVYESLLVQTCRDFEWLIIDDGSSDPTPELVKKWQQDKATWFPIRYIWQENQHKKAAHNRAVLEAKGELFLTFDSDDRCVPHALERFAYHWANIPNGERQHFSAVTSLCCDEEGQIIGDLFPGDEWIDSNTLEISYRFRVRGEKWGFHRTDVLKEFLFPAEALTVQGLVPEGVIWNQIAEKYQTRFVNEILRIYHTNGLQQGVLQVTSQKQIKQNAEGRFFSSKFFLEKYFHYLRFDPVSFVKVGAQVTRYFLHLPHEKCGKFWPAGLYQKVWIIVCFPLGVLLYLRDLLRRE